MLTHASTSQFANKKVHMISTRDVGTCRHLDVSARVGTFRGVGTFSGADTCQHIPVCKQKVHMISIRDVGTCRHLNVSAPSQVSAPFQVLIHASTSQFANKKVHMISTRDVGTCRHLDVSALCPVSAPFQDRHMPAHPSLQTKSPYD